MRNTDRTQTLFITGATSGIGRHAALALARAGHHVIATGRNEASLESLREEARGTRMHVLAMDVTDAASIARAVEEVDRLTEGKGVDVLINNAGFGTVAPLIETPDADIRAQYETNVFGLMAVTRAFVPRMIERRRGRIVNVSSAGGRVTLPFFGAYNSTKYAVESLSDALRRELLPFGIDVALIEPGPIKTEFSNRSMSWIAEGGDRSSRYTSIVSRADALKVRVDAQSAPPSVVTRAIRHAVEARRPRVRYVMPFSTRLGLAFASWMPTRLLDFVLRIAMGLTRKNLLGAPKVSTTPEIGAGAA